MSGYGYLDGHRAPARPLSRFLVFALAVIVSVGGLERPTLLPAGREWRPVRRPVRGQPDRARGDPVEPRPDLRPRRQRPRHERADVRGQDPAGRPARRPARRGGQPALGADRRGRRRHQQGDRRQSRFAIRRGARRPGRPEGDGEPDRRGELRAAGRRGRRRGPPPVHRRPAVLADPRLHGPGVRGADHRTEGRRLPAGRPPRQDRPRGVLRERPARHVRRAEGRARRLRPRPPGPRDGERLAGRRLAQAHDRHARAEARPAGPPVGHEGGGPQARRDHRHEPPDRRDPGDGQPADVRRQPLRPGDQREGLRRAAREPGQAAPQPRDRRPLPTRLHLQARDRDRRARRPQDHGQHEGPDEAVPDARIDPVLRLEPPRVRRLHDLLRLRALERHVLLPDGGQARHRPARPLGQPVRVRAADRHRPAGRGLRHRPDERVEAAGEGREDLPRRGLPGRHRPGLRRRHADPADQRLRGPRQRRQALPAAARPRRRRARRHRGPPVPAEAHPQARRPVGRAEDDARGRPIGRHAAAHVQPRRPADRRRRQVRHRRVRDARLQGPPAVPLVVRRVHAEGPVQACRTTRTA